MNLNNKPPISQTDKLCLAALAVILIATTIFYEVTDGVALRAANEDNSKIEVVAATPPIDCAPIVKAIESAREATQADPYDEAIPLSLELQTVLREACEANSVPLCNAIGVIQVESNFRPDANNGICIGLMQCNERYASVFEDATGRSIYTPEGNIRGGVWYLGTLLDRYNGDTHAALTAYNAGRDTGDRRYARAVLDASEKWGCG